MTEKMKPSGIECIGDIPVDWYVKRLKYACQKITDGSHFSPDTIDEGKVYITVTDLYGDAVHTEVAKKISPADFNMLVRNGCKPQIGDVLLSKDGTVGRTAIVDDNNDYVVLSSIGILTPKNYLLSKYLKYNLDGIHMQEQMMRAMDGSALKRITISKIAEFFAVVPPMNEQKVIVDFLDVRCAHIDSVMEDIEKQIEILQKYKKSLITEVVTKGVDKTVSMKDSGSEWIGQIPENWKTIPLKHLFSLYAGGDVNEYDFSNEQSEKYKYPIYSNSLENKGLFGYTSKYRFSGETFTVTGRGEVGKAFPRFEPYYPIVRLLVCVPKNEANSEYYSYCVNSSDVLGDQTAMAQLTTQKLGRLVVPVPPVYEQKVISDYLNNRCAQIDSVIYLKMEQLNVLQQHKKSLIYEYVTGKKRVTEAI